MTRSPTSIGDTQPPADASSAVGLARKMWVLRHVGKDLSPLRPHDLDPGVAVIVEVEADSDHAAEVVEAAPAHDHEAVPLDHLHRTAVVGHDLVQLVEDRLDRVLEVQRLPEYLCYGQERLGVLPRALEVGDVVVDRGEADPLAIDPERHEHHLHVHQLPVLPYATSDPIGTTDLSRLVSDGPAFLTEVLIEDEVVDQTSDRLRRRVAEQVRRRRVPAGHSLVDVHDHDGDRADLDERLQLVQPATRLGELGREVDLRRRHGGSILREGGLVQADSGGRRP